MRFVPAVLLLLCSALSLQAQAARSGQEVYTTCSACHLSNGAGITGVFPPLVSSPWVTENSERLIAIVLHGLSGEITVDGDAYNSVMPGQGATLSDAEVANVLTYIRSTFGNTASEITVGEVRKVRAATTGQSSPFTLPQLEARYPDPVRLR